MKFMRKMELQLSSLSTSARLMNILETEHWRKSATPTRLCSSGNSKKEGEIGSANTQEMKSTNSPAARSPRGMAPTWILPPNTGQLHPSMWCTMPSTHSVWKCSG
jgi:hypothetical protein